MNPETKHPINLEILKNQETKQNGITCHGYCSINNSMGFCNFSSSNNLVPQGELSVLLKSHEIFPKTQA